MDPNIKTYWNYICDYKNYGANSKLFPIRFLGKFRLKVDEEKDEDIEEKGEEDKETKNKEINNNKIYFLLKIKPSNEEEIKVENKCEKNLDDKDERYKGEKMNKIDEHGNIPIFTAVIDENYCLFYD